MARLPYFPMFPADFEAKTSHLTLAEDGAYNRLLRLMWMTPGCSLPDDDAWIRRRMRCTEDEFESVVRVVIDEFCIRSNGRVSNAKLSLVFEESNAAHERRVNAGRIGGKAKSLKKNKTDVSNAKAIGKQPEPEPEPEQKEVNPLTPLDVLRTVLSEKTATDFMDHRKAMKKPVTTVAAERLIAKVADHPNPDAVFDESIANGWQGIFPERTKNGTRKKDGQAAELARQIGEEWATRDVDRWSGSGSSKPLLPARDPD